MIQCMKIRKSEHLLPSDLRFLFILKHNGCAGVLNQDGDGEGGGLELLLLANASKMETISLYSIPNINSWDFLL